MIYLLKDCEHVIAPDRHRKEALDMKQSRSGLLSGMGQLSGLLASCLGQGSWRALKTKGPFKRAQAELSTPVHAS